MVNDSVEQLRRLLAESYSEDSGRPGSPIDNVCRRAFAVLPQATEHELLDIAERLDNLFFCWAYPEETGSGPSDIDDYYDDLIWKEQNHHYTSATELYHRREEAERSVALEVTRYPWDWYFAVLSLTFVAEARGDYQSAVDRSDKNDARVQAAHLMSFARHVATAMEAVGYAEILGGHDPVVASGVGIVRSTQASQAAKARHQPVRDLKAEFWRYHEGGSFRSRADAARRFYDGLPQEKQRLLARENAVRTLVESLRK